MNGKFAVLHLMAYAVVAPFWAGFSISLCKYVLETQLSLPLALVSAIGCGLGAIVFFGVPGLVVASVSLPFAVIGKLNKVSNAIACLSFGGWAYQSTGFAKGYTLFVCATGAAFFLSICLCEGSVLSQMKTVIYEPHQLGDKKHYDK